MKAKWRLPRNAVGLRTALGALGIAYRFNTRAMRPEFRIEGTAWRETNDRTEARIQEDIAERFTTGTKRDPLRFGGGKWQQSLNALLTHAEVDPFLDYLHALLPWDGISRLDDWLETVFTVTSPGLLPRWVERFLFLAPCGARSHPAPNLTRCRSSLDRKASERVRLCG